MASNRKPESIGIAGNRRRCNQNDRGDAFGRKPHGARNVGIAFNIRRKCLGKKESSLGRVGGILAAECGAEEGDWVGPVGKHESSDSDRE